ncbi:hypothetical protein R1sor_008838 [Riccia sorocarpa]|uniref:Uncharacterized protein n=1 Tax=Riccia sorocarpa TaxID=122646 RepID=A0ABD3H6W2_9MARC
MARERKSKSSNRAADINDSPVSHNTRLGLAREHEFDKFLSGIVSPEEVEAENVIGAESTVSKYDDITSVDNGPKRSTIQDLNLRSHEDFFRADSENVTLGYDAPRKQREEERAPQIGSSSVTRRSRAASHRVFGETESIEGFEGREIDVAAMADHAEHSAGVDDVEPSNRSRDSEIGDVSEASHHSCDSHEATASPHRAVQLTEAAASPPRGGRATSQRITSTPQVRASSSKSSGVLKSVAGRDTTFEMSRIDMNGTDLTGSHG